MWHWFSAFGLCAPFAVLLVLWATLIRYFEVNPRWIPNLESMAYAGLKAIKDSAVVQHIGVGPLRITVGMVVALAIAIPLGIHRRNSSWKKSTTESIDKRI